VIGWRRGKGEGGRRKEKGGGRKEKGGRRKEKLGVRAKKRRRAGGADGPVRGKGWQPVHPSALRVGEKRLGSQRTGAQPFAPNVVAGGDARAPSALLKTRPRTSCRPRNS